MPKYKIHIDKPLPDPKRIESFKNFDSLYEQYQVSTRFEFWRNLYRKPTYFASIIAIVAIGFLVFDAAKDIPAQHADFINPPIPPKDIQPVDELYENVEPLTFSYESGSKIIVPADAFVDQNGNPIVGKVELRYREFRNAAEIFIGGVPMEYDTAGLKHTMESAAMLEISAWQNGESVFLKEGKNIEVQYVSSYGSRDFSVYYLDTLKRNWVYRGKDEVEEIAMATPPRPGLQSLRDADADTFITRNVRIPPVKPQRLFFTSFSLANLPNELKGKSGMFWEWIPMDSHANPWEGNPVPTQLPLSNVKRYRMPGVYELAFSGSIENHLIVARPVQGIESQEDADRWYQSQLTEYEQKLQLWRQAQNEAAQKRRELEEARKLQLEWEAEMERRKGSTPKSWNRKFLIDQLGITQIGRKVANPPKTMMVSFTDTDGNPISKQLIKDDRALYTIIPNVNTIFRCELVDDKSAVYRLFFDPEQLSPVWSSTKNEDLLLFKAEDFGDLEKGSNETIEFQIPLTHIQTRQTDSDSLKQILFDSMDTD